MSKIVNSVILEGYFARMEDGKLILDTHRDTESCSKAFSARVEGKPYPDCKESLESIFEAAMMNRRGRFTVTVEFDPYDDVGSNPLLKN